MSKDNKNLPRKEHKIGDSSGEGPLRKWYIGDDGMFEATRVDINTGYSCMYCGKAFNQNSGLADNSVIACKNCIEDALEFTNKFNNRNWVLK